MLSHAFVRSPTPAVGGSSPSCPASYIRDVSIRKEEVVRVADEKQNDEKRLGLVARIGLFYRQVISELRKVVWPTRKQLTTYTSVVLVFVAFIITVVSLLDVVLTKIVFWVFG